MPRPAIGVLPDAMEPGFHCVRTHWIRGFMAFRLARRTRTVVLVRSEVGGGGEVGQAGLAGR